MTKMPFWFTLVVVALVGFASCLLFAFRAGSSPAGDPTENETSIGIVRYVAPPDLTICFCGPFSLVGEKEQTAFYLFSREIDLSQYVGVKVSVTGKPFKTVCEGTLFRLCDFLDVSKVEALAPLPTEVGTWGRIKSLYE